MIGKDRKAGKAALLALILTMLMASSAWADTMGAVVPVTGEQSAPPGSEGTVLASVIISGDAAQAMENQGNQGPGVVSQEETQTGTEGQTELQPAEESQTETGAEITTQASGRDIDPSKPMVALTFDDGPQTSVGNQIMDCLAQYGGKATFFLVGDRVASRSSEVQRMVAEGHEVANHTMNHKYLQSLGAAEIQTQVNQCNDVIQSVCGVRPTLMRLPGGNHNATVVANTGMPMIQWSIDTLDWKTRDTASTVSTVLNQVQDGDIVLMHELYEATGNAVLQIVPELVNRGYQIVTVSEMAAAKGYSLQAGQLYSALR